MRSRECKNARHTEASPSRNSVSLIMQFDFEQLLPYNEIAINYQTVFCKYVAKRVSGRIFGNVKTHVRASLHANRL